MRKYQDNLIQHYIEDLKRTKLSEYCLNGCSNNCCTRLSEFNITSCSGQIFLLYEKEFNQNPKTSKQKFIESKISELSEKRVLSRRADSRDLFVYKSPVCPRYDHSTKKCEIHENPERSPECAEFPIHFTEDNMTLGLDVRCSFIGKNLKEIFSGLGKNNLKKIENGQIIVKMKGIHRM